MIAADMISATYIECSDGIADQGEPIRREKSIGREELVRIVTKGDAISKNTIQLLV